MSTPDREAAALRLLNDFETLRRSLRLYPDTHPALEPARDRVRDSAIALGLDGQTAIFAFGPEKMFWDQVELSPPPANPTVSLGLLLFRLGLSALGLKFPDVWQDLVAFADVLARLHDPPRDSDRQQVLDLVGTFANLELVPLDLSMVQVSEDDDPEKSGSRMVWSELARRLSRDGVFALAGQIDEGELSPGQVLKLLSTSADPETLFDHLFMQLANLLRDSVEIHRGMMLGRIREFLGELVHLLDPERSKLAVAVAIRHLPVAGDEEHGTEPLVAAELLLDTVEFMLLEGSPVPEAVQRALYRMCAPMSAQTPAIPEELTVRARHLLSRLPLTQPGDVVVPVPPENALTVDWSGSPWARELVASLEEEQVRLHMVRVLKEAVTLWPREVVAERAAGRLGEEFVTAIDAGDFETAGSLAPLLAAARNPEAAQLAYDTGVPALVDGLKTYDRQLHPVLIQILSSLGEHGIPSVLDALAAEESLAVRKRLIEVVARQGLRAAPYLYPLLDDQRWFVVRNAVFLLRHVGDPRLAALVKNRIANAHPQVAAEMLKALVAVGDPHWLLWLKRTLDSKDEARERAALSVASRIRNPKVVEALSERLGKRMGKRLREPFSQDLIQALGRLRDPAALPVLRQVLDLKQWRFPFPLGVLRRDAAVAIARIEGPEAHRISLELTHDADPEVAEAVKRTLRTPSEPEEGEEGL